VRLAGAAVLVALFALACHLWRRGYRDEAAERNEARQFARHTKVYIVNASRWIGDADPFYDDDDGDGTGGAAA